MNEVSLLRLYVMRATFLLIAVGEGMQIWPLIFRHRPWSDPMHGVAVALLAALTLLCWLGVRYPLKMAPLMLFEGVWKTIWMLAIGIPAWQAGPLTPAMAENMFAIGLGVVLVPLILPWPYLWRSYVTAKGDRWR
ncbi:hypothetical protein QO010_003921 [Caulobacter ginsengisoli]|uniref:LrgA n=1 Tax=Caulobacter ginsengisoli TaxID=400775 RepID=A0ABU0IVS8_9CAUL|nr:hypothetical protein [Caulobacter ginsengisoli]MDQ0466128.1 hypothetical protein [Caulobacter ginsengisoli]